MGAVPTLVSRRHPRLGGLEIDNQLEIGGSLDREIGWLDALRQLGVYAGLKTPLRAYNFNGFAQRGNRSLQNPRKG